MVVGGGNLCCRGELCRSGIVRNFLKVAGVASAASLAGASHANAETGKRIFTLSTQDEPARPVAANDHIQIALIGAGGQGMGDTALRCRCPGVKLVAVADCYDGRLARSKEVWGDDVFTTRDYKEILARKDIDAVIIGTPDHWHKQAVGRCDEGGQGRVLREADDPSLRGWAGDDRDSADDEPHLQIGSQRVSSILYAKAKELLASGAIGKLNMVTAHWDRNSSMGAWNYTIPPDASPETCDWPQFLGTRSEDSVQRGTIFPMAQVEGVRQRRSRRLVCASIQRDKFCDRHERAHAGHGDRRDPLSGRMGEMRMTWCWGCSIIARDSISACA